MESDQNLGGEIFYGNPTSVGKKSLNRSPGGFLLKDAHHLHFTTAWLQARGSWIYPKFGRFCGTPQKKDSCMVPYEKSLHRILDIVIVFPGDVR